MRLRKWAAKARLVAGTVGYFDTIRLVIGWLRQGTPRPIRVRVKGCGHPVVVRTGASSDFDVLMQIFVDRQYGALDQLQPSLIVDCGANVGYASVYFLNRFPHAHVIAVEPDPRNIAICRKNLEPYADRVRLVEGAVWGKRQELSLVDRVVEWGTEVTDGEGSGGIAAFDLPSLVPGDAPISLLKIDVEGAETNVFGDGSERWLDRVENIAIELHGPQHRSVFQKALEPYTCRSFESGEVTVCLGLRRRAAAERQWEAATVDRR